MTYWPDILNVVHPDLIWTLRDSINLDTLEVEVDGVMRKATDAEKTSIRERADSAMPEIAAREARQGKVKQMLSEFEPEHIYDLAVNDRLDELKARVKEIEGL